MLTRDAILQQVMLGNIVITPFDEKCIGSNSYDLHLYKMLKVYDCAELDCRKQNPTIEFEIPEEGFVLQPGILYLGSTIEYTETDLHIPEINGKSSLGRLGLDIHKTAGFGDLGFRGQWTLEMVVVLPLRIYPGQKIAQLQFDVPVGPITHLYRNKPDQKYANQSGPTASKMHENFSNAESNGLG